MFRPSSLSFSRSRGTVSQVFIRIVITFSRLPRTACPPTETLFFSISWSESLTAALSFPASIKLSGLFEPLQSDTLAESDLSCPSAHAPLLSI